jgi:Fic family protein
LTDTSNAIEGNTLTRSETAIVLEKGITIGGKPLKDHLEALGHRDALGFVRTLAQAGEKVREIDIREMHRLIMTRLDPEEAGRYSTHQRTIAEPYRRFMAERLEASLDHHIEMLERATGSCC